MSEMAKIALAGNPNCGKTALFNALTGGREKVGNYPGVTVERREGQIALPSGTKLNVLDLPGTYSLDARTPDEAITRDIILGRREKESPPKLFVAVADATNLERCLGLVLELRELRKPVVLALNMMDLATQRGMSLDLPTLTRELKVPIVPTVAVKKQGISDLLKQIENELQVSSVSMIEDAQAVQWNKPNAEQIRNRFAEVDRILSKAIHAPPKKSVWTERIDRVVLHPLWGSLLLVVILALMFQAIFTWATVPQDWITNGLNAFGSWVGGLMHPGPLRSLLVDGIIAGVGSVVAFLPQILILFAFILLLEDSGYMARAAFLMDRLMGRVGLHGRAFIPLLSSYACAIPGIMATRTIEDRRDRLTTILIAPLTTCSARLPVYTLLISAFIPNRAVLGPFRLQGLVMFGLYLLGIIAALAMAVIFRRTILRGPRQPLLMELPTYKWPSIKSMLLGLTERSRLFLQRAGTVILAAAILIWFLSSYPKPPANAPVGPHAKPAIAYSYAGRIGRSLEPIFRPVGFNWQIDVALIPGFAAREVMIGALGTVYAVSGADKEVNSALSSKIGHAWALPTALSLMIWYVLSLQCASTVAVTRRETNSWRWPIFMLLYMTVLAYSGAFLVFHLARWMGL